MRIIFLLLLLSHFAMGHGDLHKQIKDITAKIKSSPNNPQLLLTRAKLYQSHRDPKSAHQDLLKATKLTPPHPAAFLELARFERKHEKFPSAKAALKTYFDLSPTPTPSAHREQALLLPPEEAIDSWQLFLKSTGNPSMHDYALAAQTVFDANNQQATQKFIKSGLTQHPKSIKLHHLHARTLIVKNEIASAEESFRNLKLLYPNLLVKLNYEESQIWEKHKHPNRAKKALLSSLKSYQNLPTRFQKNRDIQNLVAKIQAKVQK